MVGGHVHAYGGRMEQVDDKIKEAITDYIKKRLAPRQIKIRSDIEVTCFTYEGIDAIKVRARRRPVSKLSGFEALTDGGGGVGVVLAG